MVVQFCDGRCGGLFQQIKRPLAIVCEFEGLLHSRHSHLPIPLRRNRFKIRF